jgi:hypothetical protein
MTGYFGLDRPETEKERKFVFKTIFVNDPFTGWSYVSGRKNKKITGYL